MKLQHNIISGGLYWVQRWYFPLFCVVGAGVYAIQRWGDGGVLPRWVAHYLNDFLCMPIVLFIGRFVVRILKSDKQLNLPVIPILSLTCFYALYFEAYLPGINARYTADPMDVLMYFMGAAFFYLMENVIKTSNGIKVMYDEGR